MKKTNKKYYFSERLKYIFSLPIIIFIKFYQYCISPWLRPSCRFYPTCSQYALEALKRFGPFRGSILTIWRILRCNPWGGQGFDPVPNKFKLN